MLLRGACPGADAAGGGAEGDSWEEEGFGSSSPVKSPAAAYFLGSSFSPVRCGGPGDVSPRGCGARRAGEGACSPLPDHPGTPPHKTFRKLRLFDTPHTPKRLIGAVQVADDLTPAESVPPRAWQRECGTDNVVWKDARVSLLSKARGIDSSSVKLRGGSLFMDTEKSGKREFDVRQTPQVNINPFTPDSVLLHSSGQCRRRKRTYWNE
ncbi:Wee1-like protein kinase [Camelus dromedarius]|uniref:Wee1-like protein kinase n=1 Tax=Camelus dromedarius TaxID=9838 RepID=A0A5N4DNG7_CAMDR|nr:Wee1-like protein kinase [Camelus dromedarius]